MRPARPIARAVLQRILARQGFTLERVDGRRAAFSEDGLTTDHAHEFIRDPLFVRAYRRGVAAAGDDYHIRWRAHIALWAAACASHWPGDFVECGLNRGFLSSAIMEALDWDRLGKTFFLSIPSPGSTSRCFRPRSATERSELTMCCSVNGFYVRGVESVLANFSEWSNVRIVVGSVPASLAEVDVERVAYLHLDMNASTPEIAALEFFWPRLEPGAMVLLDDYGFPGPDAQRVAMDAFADAHDATIACPPNWAGADDQASGSA